MVGIYGFIRKFLSEKSPETVDAYCFAFMVDLEGFEPLTSRMRTERSPNAT